MSEITSGAAGTDGPGVTATYTVAGMTCGHCVNSVSTEVGAIPGVTGVQVDLASGTVQVTSAAPIEPGLVKAAVDEAGYELVSS
jgi:copper chaperone